MSEKFSVEDILNEVNAMSGDYYYNNSAKSVKSETPFNKQRAEFNEAEIDEIDEAKQVKKVDEINEAQKSNEANTSFLPNDIDENDIDEIDNDDLDISKMTTDEFFKMLEIGLDSSSKKSNKQSTKALLENEDDKKQAEINLEEKQEEAVETIESPVKKADPEEKSVKTAPEQTVVFDKNELKNAIENQENLKLENTQNSEPVQKDLEEASDQEASKEPTLLGDIKVKRSHKPEHLLSPEEIINNSMNKAPSFRFSDMVKDLTKPKANDKKPFVFQEDLEDKAKTESADTVVDKLGEQFEMAEKENARPDLLNNEIEFDDEYKINPADEYKIEKKQIDESELDLNNAPNIAYAKKTMRRITETTFDYSEDSNQDEDVIDDYTSIEDEEPVKRDLDLSVKKISKRLSLNIITFIIAFVFGVLPQFNIELISAISPSENQTGFYIFNAVILFLTLIINIKSFFRGLGSLLTFKPDADSPNSIASLLVIASSAIVFVPKFTSSASALPFFTASLIFSYILSLIGKKSMVTRIKSNFRLVATTNPKQACFVADERLSQMLENDDFIGYPEVATSKSVINLHNYLKNSYCEDPSDNLSRIFSPIAVLALLSAFAVTYIMSADVVLSLFYSTAVALLCVPASAVLAVNSPIKKACNILRHKEGLISGYNAVEEFSNIDCVAIDADDLFPAGTVEMLSLRAVGDASIEDVILKSAALTINAGGPLADVFYKIIDGRRKMLPPISDIVYEDGLGLTGKIEGKTVRVGNRKLIDSYGIYGLFDDSLEQKAKSQGFFIVYTAVDDEVCGMFVVKYKSFYADIEDALYELVDNNITIAVKTNDPNITPELIEKVFAIPSDYVVMMQAHTAEHYDELIKPLKNGDSMLAYNGNSSTLAMLITACKKLRKKISLAVLLQSILTVLGFCACLISIVLDIGTEYITPINIIGYQFATAIISHLFPSLIKRIK